MNHLNKKTKFGTGPKNIMDNLLKSKSVEYDYPQCYSNKKTKEFKQLFNNVNHLHQKAHSAIDKMIRRVGQQKKLLSFIFQHSQETQKLTLRSKSLFSNITIKSNIKSEDNLRTFTCIFQQISVGISKNSSMNQSTSMDMLNSTIDIIVDVRGIKLKFGVDKILDHVSNKTCLKKVKRNIAINKSDMTV